MNLADQAQAFLQGRRSAWREQLKDTQGGDRFWVWAFRCLYPTGWFYRDKVWMYRVYENRADVDKALDSIGLNRVDVHAKPGSLDESWHVRNLHLPNPEGGDWVWVQPGRTESAVAGAEPKYP